MLEFVICLLHRDNRRSIVVREYYFAYCDTPPNVRCRALPLAAAALNGRRMYGGGWFFLWCHCWHIENISRPSSSYLYNTRYHSKNMYCGCRYHNFVLLLVYVDLYWTGTLEFSTKSSTRRSVLPLRLRECCVVWHFGGMPILICYIVLFLSGTCDCLAKKK